MPKFKKTLLLLLLGLMCHNVSLTNVSRGIALIERRFHVASSNVPFLSFTFSTTFCVMKQMRSSSLNWAISFVKVHSHDHTTTSTTPISELWVFTCDPCVQCCAIVTVGSAHKLQLYIYGCITVIESRHTDDTVTSKCRAK